MSRLEVNLASLYRTTTLARDVPDRQKVVPTTLAGLWSISNRNYNQNKLISVSYYSSNVRITRLKSLYIHTSSIINFLICFGKSKNFAIPLLITYKQNQLENPKGDFSPKDCFANPPVAARICLTTVFITIIFYHREFFNKSRQGQDCSSFGIVIYCVVPLLLFDIKVFSNERNVRSRFYKTLWDRI